MTPEQRASVLAKVNELLDHEAVTVDLRVGTVSIPNYVTGYREAKPTDGWTLTIKVNGGAKDVVLD